jgi:hypothetical protein
MTMTEEEWVRATHQEVMLLHARLSPRRQRLLVLAICRLLHQWVDYPVAHAAMETVATFIETGKSKTALRRAREAIQELRLQVHRERNDAVAFQALFVVFVAAATEGYLSGAVPQASQAIVMAEHTTEEMARKQLYRVYREVAGPTLPVAFDPNWRTSAAVQLAAMMYDARDFALMPILADALEDAGCDSPDVLAHCREPGAVHVRGCWVVDLVLGKS